jgi:hypothetical protein
MQTFTTQKQSISPTVMMVIHQSSKPIVTLSFPNGGRINVLKVNHFTHRCEMEKQVSLQGPCTAYLVNAGIEANKNINYLVLRNEEKQCYCCSCYDYRKDQACSHADSVDQHVKAEKMAQAVIEPVAAAKQEQLEVTPSQWTVAQWREIVRQGRERDRAYMNEFWEKAKLLQAQVHQPQQSQAGV